MRGRVRSTSQAACDSGRMERPVLVSGRTAVRRARSTSCQRSATASPLRQPVKAKKRRHATAGGQIVASAMPQPGAERGIFGLRQPPLAPVLREFPYPVRRIVGPHVVVDRIGEDRPQQPDRPSGNAASAAHSGNPARLGLATLRRLAGRYRMHEFLDVLLGHRGHRQAPQQGFHVPLDPAMV